MVHGASDRFRRGRKVGKYKLLKKLGEGGFGVVYKAYDEVEGQHVALKIQAPAFRSERILQYFKHEIRLMSRIEHRNVLKMKNADLIDGRLFIASELGLCSLAERKRRAIRSDFALSILLQMLEALMEVQKNNIVHRDIKPENIILFPDNIVKLGDFGIAKVLERVGQATATDTGTQGYFAPEQIFGKPSFASDIFSLGLVFYEMITGDLPKYPFRWPLAGKERFHRRVSGNLRHIIRKSLAFDEEQRYPDARSMHHDIVQWSQRRSAANNSQSRRKFIPWRKYREMEFDARFHRALSLDFKCCKCNGPISEYMMFCPWCGTDKNSFKGLSLLPSVCRRCEHGVMEEWDYCPWCYGPKFAWADIWVNPDKRYVKKCPNKYCGERNIMMWMHYCPWCRTKLKPWRHPLLEDACGGCSWGIAGDFWEYCPWCGKEVP
ncbi:MAG: protein kinase [Candidatus Lindowbacteria bacterium]|nr:protein kinase [Candidatus Lindowbacteria bacterium]